MVWSIGGPLGVNTEVRVIDSRIPLCQGCYKPSAHDFIRAHYEQY
jgi:hypothetical protein